MDPLSALIGGAFSLFGGELGAQATSSANAANIAQAQWQATGGYLPGLVRNAQAAGINPLAVIPGGGGSANIQSVSQVGSALGDIGQNLARMKLMTTPEDPHKKVMDDLSEKSGRAQVERETAEAIIARHNANNLTGTPALGGANANMRLGKGFGPHPIGTAIKDWTGDENPNFLLKIPAEIGDAVIGGTRAAGRGMADWISRWGVSGMPTY